LFHAARWKAYLKELQTEEENGTLDSPDKDPNTVIMHIYHRQKIWFTQEEENGHQKAARESLKKCDQLLTESQIMNDILEETLANTPKPSTVLDWSRLW
jgi:hypothetical protein